jgi:hypothetical protein
MNQTSLKSIALVAALGILGCHPAQVAPDVTSYSAQSQYDKVTGITTITSNRKIFIPAFAGWILPVATRSDANKQGFWISYRFIGKVDLAIQQPVSIYVKTADGERRYACNQLEQIRVYPQSVDVVNEGKLANNVASGLLGVLAPHANRPEATPVVQETRDYTCFEMFVATDRQVFHDLSVADDSIIRVQTSLGHNDITIKYPLNIAFLVVDQVIQN